MMRCIETNRSTDLTWTFDGKLIDVERLGHYGGQNVAHSGQK